MTAPAPTRRAVFSVVNPTAEPPRSWIHAVAVMLLAHADQEIQRERAAAEKDGDEEDMEGTKNDRSSN